MALYTNPVIPGFYPDPSILKTDDGYYLVNSSFEFYPGVPLFHSVDLVSWTQVGYVLNRPAQLRLENARTSGGIYAPTLRFHDGVYYMVVTNVSDGGNFYVRTGDIRGGSWSDPIYVKQRGIDPSLFFDGGKVYFASTHADGQGRQCIGQCEIDIETGEMLTETKPIWYGTGGKCPEGPHMFKLGGRYYLMLAEGGTEYGHMVTIARGDSPWGPFEGCPRNPILTHRDINPRENILQGLGHADLTQGPDGGWWMVFHGIRPSRFMLHHLGRETCIAPLTWDGDGWPLVNGGERIPLAMAAELPGFGPEERIPQAVNDPFRDDFSAPELGLAWSYLRNPQPGNYSLSDTPGSLTMRAAARGLDDQGSPTFIGRRQQHFEARVETAVDFAPVSGESRAGLTIFHTAEHHYDLFVTRRDGKRAAVLRRRAADMVVESPPVFLPEEGPVTLRAEASRLEYTFYAGADTDSLARVGAGGTQLLSTEVMICTFTGCFTGLFVQGKEGEEARFASFSYLPGETAVCQDGDNGS